MRKHKFTGIGLLFFFGCTAFAMRPNIPSPDTLIPATELPYQVELPKPQIAMKNSVKQVTKTPPGLPAPQNTTCDAKPVTPALKTLIPYGVSSQLVTPLYYTPQPNREAHKHNNNAPITLTLQDAILLALRTNPTVQTSELTRVVDKYTLMLAHLPFEPEYSFSLDGTYATKQDRDYTMNVTGGIKSTIGTQLDATVANGLDGAAGTTTLNLTQPLLQGFGFVNIIPYLDAVDNERVARLNFKLSIIGVVNQVIAAYRSLVEEYSQLDIQKRTLLDNEETVRQYELQVQAGKAAPSDLLQQKANLEQTRLSYVQAVNSVAQSYQSFLSALGLIPNANVVIDKKIYYHSYKLPPLKECIRRALDGNIAYRQAVIQLNNTERAVATAEDSRKWTLNLTASTAFGDTAGGPGEPLTSANTGPSVGFTLTVPIDDLSAKAGVEEAKIALEQAKINLENTKEELIRSIINKVRNIKNTEMQVKVSRDSVNLQEQSLRDEKIKEKYGKVTVFEVNSIQDTLVSDQSGLVSTEISYLNLITDLQSTFGTTLDKWNIKLRY